MPTLPAFFIIIIIIILFQSLSTLTQTWKKNYDTLQLQYIVLQYNKVQQNASLMLSITLLVEFRYS